MQNVGFASGLQPLFCSLHKGGYQPAERFVIYIIFFFGAVKASDL
jgi:hypothetical protein